MSTSLAILINIENDNKINLLKNIICDHPEKIHIIQNTHFTIFNCKIVSTYVNMHQLNEYVNYLFNKYLTNVTLSCPTYSIVGRDPVFFSKEYQYNNTYLLRKVTKKIHLFLQSNVNNVQFEELKINKVKVIMYYIYIKNRKHYLYYIKKHSRYIIKNHISIAKLNKFNDNYCNMLNNCISFINSTNNDILHNNDDIIHLNKYINNTVISVKDIPDIFLIKDIPDILPIKDIPDILPIKDIPTILPIKDILDILPIKDIPDILPIKDIPDISQ
jgi:hypothetical protein